MNGGRNTVRSSFLNHLRKAFFLSREASKKNSPPIDELTERLRCESASRRNFIGNFTKAGLAVGAAGLLNACRKGVDVIDQDTGDDSLRAAGTQPKIIIVGAGIAGLTCAHYLRKAGYASKIFEASSRPGGRIMTRYNTTSPGLYTELGGEFIDSNHQTMLSLCRHFNLPLLDMRESAEEQYSRDNFFIDGIFYTEEQVIRGFEPYAETIAADNASLPPYIGFDSYNDAAYRFDQMSIAEYLDSIGMTGFIRKGIEAAYLTEYGLETNVQSAINFLYLFSADTSNGFQIFGTSDERYKVEGGNQRLTDTLYYKMQNRVELQYQLVKIKKDATGYTLFFNDPNNTVIRRRADIVVLCIPFTILRKIEMDIDMPAWKTQSIQTLSYGTNSKLILGFSTRVWRRYLNSGYVFTDGAIGNGWDATWMEGAQEGEYTVFQGGQAGLDLGNGTALSQAPQFVAQMEQMWPGSSAAYNGKAFRMQWPSFPLTLGSYICYTKGQYTSIGGAEKMPVDNLYFAGEHCSYEYQGFMEGAAETGKAVGIQIAAAIRG